jgi:hypothetical protein
MANKMAVLGVIIFGSVWFLSKKNNQTEIKRKRNRVKRIGFSSVWFLGQKPVQTGLTWFFRFWLGFFGLAWFFWFGSGFFLVFLFRFGFFGFCL